METRVLVALEDEYRVYREVLAAGVQALRPGVRVATTVPSGLPEEMARFDPQVVICSDPHATDSKPTTTWVKISTDPSQPTLVRLGDRDFERRNPDFDALLEVVDEAGRLATGEEGDKPG